MKSHFHSKSLLFYGGMISTVLILFRLTSAYGEKHLKAPPDINGRYLSMQAPPGCPDATRLAITILQSGVFLHGAVHVEEPGAEVKANASQDKPSLNGRWRESQVVLSGPTGALPCPTTASSSPAEVTIQGQINSSAPDVPAVLTGELSIAGGQTWQFSAERQAPQAKSSEH